MGGFLTNSEKCNAKEKIQKQTNKFREAIARKQRFGHNYLQIHTGLYLLSPTWGHDGVFNSFIPNVWFSSRVPMVDLIGLYEDETGNFPITTRFPTLCCKTEVSRAMEPLDQNGSRTSLQDRNPACKWNLLSQTYDTLGRALAHLTKNPTGRHSG